MDLIVPAERKSVDEREKKVRSHGRGTGEQMCRSKPDYGGPRQANDSASERLQAWGQVFQRRRNLNQSRNGQRTRKHEEVDVSQERRGASVSRRAKTLPASIIVNIVGTSTFGQERKVELGRIRRGFNAFFNFEHFTASPLSSISLFNIYSNFIQYNNFD